MMKLQGVLLFFLSCPPDRQAEFNQWYDTDHLPENRALPGVFHAQRYVAPPEYRALREATALRDGGGSYLTVYFTENEVRETQKHVITLATQLREGGRFPDYFDSPFGAAFSIQAVALRPGLVLSPGAASVMPHQGAYILLDELTDSSQEQKVMDWYDQVHIPDTLRCPGFAAAFRFRCLRRGYEGWLLHCFYLQGDPLSATRERQQRLPRWQAEGRLLDFSGVARRIFAGPYRAIAPLP
ncbi:MAG: hypothetical protein HYX99_03900 [Chloroflexi bacterium]|nr:hypothetical protein [Chloroflexota bacterium]